MMYKDLGFPRRTGLEILPFAHVRSDVTWPVRLRGKISFGHDLSEPELQRCVSRHRTAIPRARRTPSKFTVCGSMTHNYAVQPGTSCRTHTLNYHGRLRD